MTESTAGGDWLTVAQAMTALQKSDKSIRRMIERGDLSAHKVKTATGQEWRIVAADVARFAGGVPEVLPDTAGQVTDTNGRATVGETDSTGQVTEGETEQVTDSAGSTAGTLDTRRLDRMEGYLAGQMEATIAAAVERAVLAAQAPLLARIDELSEQIKAMASTMPAGASGGSQDAPQAQSEPYPAAVNYDAIQPAQRASRRRDVIGLRGLLLRWLKSGE